MTKADMQGGIIEPLVPEEELYPVWCDCMSPMVKLILMDGSNTDRNCQSCHRPIKGVDYD